MNLAEPTLAARGRGGVKDPLCCAFSTAGAGVPRRRDNAILAAKTPNFDRMMRECPHALLATSGRNVGLPDGQMGNSEVGHTNIGAGRLVMQDLPRIDEAVATGTIAERPELRALIAEAKRAAARST